MISQIETIVLNDKEVLATSHYNASNDKTDKYECIFSYNGATSHFFYYVEGGAKDDLLKALMDFCDDVIDYMNDPEMACDEQVERAESFCKVFGNNRNTAVHLQHLYEGKYYDNKRLQDLYLTQFLKQYDELYDSAIKHITDAIVMSGLSVDDTMIGGINLSYFDSNRFGVDRLYVLNGKLMFITDKDEDELEMGKEIKQMDIKQLMMIADNIYEIIDDIKEQ